MTYNNREDWLDSLNQGQYADLEHWLEATSRGTQIDITDLYSFEFCKGLPENPSDKASMIQNYLKIYVKRKDINISGSTITNTRRK